MIITKQFLASISPQKSERYSHRLWLWLKRMVGRDVDVYSCHDPVRVQDVKRYLAVGPHAVGSFLHGVELGRALREGGRAEVWAYPSAYIASPSLVADFWDDYLRIGVCLFDGHPSRGEIEHLRYDTDGDVRKCCWCGVVQHKVRWVETWERERWDVVKEEP